LSTTDLALRSTVGSSRTFLPSMRYFLCIWPPIATAQSLVA